MGLLETVDDPDADTTCLREEDSESDDEKPGRRMTPSQNHPEFANALREALAEEPAPEEPPTDDDHSTTSADLAGEVNDEMLPTPSTSQEPTGETRPAAMQSPPPRRNTSSTGLDTLAE